MIGPLAAFNSLGGLPMKSKATRAGFALAFTCGFAAVTFAQGDGKTGTTDSSKHFDPKGKPPSKFTIELQKGVRATLPFDDKRDFEEAKKGFIAAPTYKQIMAEAGNVAWDMGSYEFLLTDKEFESIHPSLQRQAVLNMAYGLYEVLPGKIYQVRGFDLANISFIKSDTGWIVFDPLTAKETAAAALKNSSGRVRSWPSFIHIRTAITSVASA